MTDIKALAFKGAQIKLKELDEQRQEIIELFPVLRFRSRAEKIERIDKLAAIKTKPIKSKFTRAARAKLAAAMRRRWKEAKAKGEVLNGTKAAR